MVKFLLSRKMVREADGLHFRTFRPLDNGFEVANLGPFILLSVFVSFDCEPPGSGSYVRNGLCSHEFYGHGQVATNAT